MPAWTLSAELTYVTPFDVLAQSNGGSDLMVHALLCSEESARTDVVKGAWLQCVHMGPPFSQREQKVDAVGTAVLTEEDIRKMKTFADDRLRERKSEEERLKLIKQTGSLRVEYCICPPAQKPTASFSLWRFSCVGFVLQAYRTARIELLGAPWPLRTLDELKQFYPIHAARLDDPVIRPNLNSHPNKDPQRNPVFFNETSSGILEKKMRSLAMRGLKGVRGLGVAELWIRSVG